MVDGLEDLDVEIACFGRVERDAKSHEGIRKTIDTDDRAMVHVRVTGFQHRVVVGVDDVVEVVGDDLGHLVRLPKVVLAFAGEGR